MSQFINGISLIYLNLLQFLPAMVCSFQCSELTLLLSNLILSVLWFLTLLGTELFSECHFQIVICEYIEIHLILGGGGSCTLQPSYAHLLLEVFYKFHKIIYIDYYVVWWYSLISSLPVYMPLILLSCLITLAGPPLWCFMEVIMSRHPCFIVSLGGKH